MSKYTYYKDKKGVTKRKWNGPRCKLLVGTLKQLARTIWDRYK